MGKLTDLSILYGTDKQPKDHNYMPIYEFWLKDRNINNMLEVGFGPGASIKMWLSAYPDANVHCIEYMGEEYESVWNKPNLNLDKLNLVIGDSTKEETWKNIPFNLDFIVDDGDHHADSMINTFLSGFSHLKSGGLYFIEDTHCPFEKKYGATDKIYQWLYTAMIRQQASHVQTGGDFYKARMYMDDLTKDIYSLHSYKSLVVIEKA